MPPGAWDWPELRSVGLLPASLDRQRASSKRRGTDQGEEVDEADIARASDLAAQPAQPGALEDGQQALVQDGDGLVRCPHPFGGEAKAQDGRDKLVGIARRARRGPDALGHPRQEAALAALLAQALGELLEGLGGDLEWTRAQVRRSLKVGPGQVRHLSCRVAQRSIKRWSRALASSRSSAQTPRPSWGSRKRRSAMRAASRGLVSSRVRSSNSRARASTKDWTRR